MDAHQINKLVSAAVADGRVAAGRRAWWEKALAEQPESAAPLLAGLASGLPSADWVV
ncbi:hypothetical protein [Prescottella equi]|uniref:hypothetical protein n=1 Tax=Rhodococcus hoagii TaxID=43767 RepID=UPI00158533BC|nr:hypothetical protein [Prescottella equi]